MGAGGVWYYDLGELENSGEYRHVVAIAEARTVTHAQECLEPSCACDLRQCAHSRAYCSTARCYKPKTGEEDWKASWAFCKMNVLDEQLARLLLSLVESLKECVEKSLEICEEDVPSGASISARCGPGWVP
jgi:hypothetical protein